MVRAATALSSKGDSATQETATTAMRILVIGGTRFIGPRVVARLVALDHEVTVAHRGEHVARLPESVRVIRDPSLGAPILRIPDALRRVSPEVVVPMMAMAEADSLAIVNAFDGVARRIVAPSSGDVYRAYAVFVGLEDAPIDNAPLDEDAPLRASRFPYRTASTAPNDIAFSYDKVLAERALASRTSLPATILRLPKVYGPEDNAELGTVYSFRNNPEWKWTHGHVENVAKAITLAILDGRATGRVYNVGERRTPTMGERLRELPPRPDLPLAKATYRFEQNIEYDTTRIRRELDYVEDLDEAVVMRELAVDR